MPQEGTAFEVDREGWTLRGETEGEGVPIVCCHGLSATRDYVLHGSSYLTRRGFRLISYDARGHGESDPPRESRYEYEVLVDDLDAVISTEIGDEADSVKPILVGHSMGAHTVAAYAARNPDAVSALVLIGPVWTGEDVTSGSDSWQRLADSLANGGPEAFAEVASEGHQGENRDLVRRLARDRTALHRDPLAVAQALREVPFSAPLQSLEELERIKAPTLVVASHDDLDPGHPYASALAYAAAINDAKLISEDEGDSPLAWQGGLLSREIHSFTKNTGLFPS